MRLFRICSALNLSEETVVLKAIDTGLPVSDQLLDCNVNAKLNDELFRATACELLGEAEGAKFVAEIKQQGAEAENKKCAKAGERNRSGVKFGKKQATNTDAIARIRGVDPAAAAEFWNKVNSAAQRRLSTYEVLTLLRAQEARASTIAPDELASIVKPPAKPPASPPTSQSSTSRTIVSTETPTNDCTPEVTGKGPPEPTEPDLKATLAQRHALSSVQAEELYNLLATMTPLGFTSSKQLSKYIVTQHLARQYPNISGIVRMEQGEREWDFKGGFPPKIYAIVCEELGLRNQGTRARPVGFTSFKDLYSSGGR